MSFSRGRWCVLANQKRWKSARFVGADREVPYRDGEGSQEWRHIGRESWGGDWEAARGDGAPARPMLWRIVCAVALSVMMARTVRRPPQWQIQTSMPKVR